MRTKTRLTLGAAALLLAAGGAQRGAAARTSLVGAYGRLPLAFEANRGQHPPDLDFLARGHGYSLGLAPTGAVLALGPRYAVRMQLVGGNARAAGAGEEPLPGVVHHLIGNEPAKWRTKLPTFARVRYVSVYPGIDLVYYGNQDRLEYDFVVQPGADPSMVALAFPGAESLSLTEDGALVLGLAGRELRWERPVVYQTVDGRRTMVAGAYRLLRADATPSGIAAGFRLGPYDPTRPLVIDPVLVYSGFPEDDGACGIAVDADLNAYVTGATYSIAFPVANAPQPANAGSQDVFVTKLDPSGTTVLYSTYLGGTAFEAGRGIAVDAANNAYVSGNTSSADFPGARDRAVAHGAAFAVRLNAAGDSLFDDRAGQAIDGPSVRSARNERR